MHPKATPRVDFATLTKEEVPLVAHDMLYQVKLPEQEMRGFWAAIKGFANMPPSDIRSIAHKAYFHRGWWFGDKVRRGLLANCEPCELGLAVPVMPQVTGETVLALKVQWVDPSSGEKFDSATELQRSYAQRKRAEARALIGVRPRKELSAAQEARLAELDACLEAASAGSDEAFFAAVASKDAYLEGEGLRRDEIESAA